MKYVHISVEGQTEETFVRELLNPYLNAYNVYAKPVIVTTKLVLNGPNYKGGLTKYQQAKRDLIKLLHDSSTVIVTTMYDLFRLPQDFPGMDSIPSRNSYEKVAYLEENFQNDINNMKFIPYIQLHEFEAFLFVNPVKYSSLINNSNQISQLLEIRKQFSNPEEINDGAQTAPSKRLQAIIPDYEKAFFGPLASIYTGIEELLEYCPHFNGWVTRLRELGS